MKRRAVALTLLTAAALAGCVTTDAAGNIQRKAEPNLAEAAQLNTQLGIDYMRKGQDELALEKLQRALVQNPNLALAHSSLGFLYARRGEFEAAERHYRRALELDQNPDTRNNFGVFLCGQNRTEQAERYFLEAAQDRRYATPEVAWTNAGVCARRLPDLAKAERYFREALRANAGFPDALAQMAWLSYEKKDYLRARAFLQRYELVGRPTPETLWIGSLTESALGDAAAARAYQERLRREFPESAESTRLSSAPSP